MERTDDTNRIKKDSNWKERFITTSKIEQEIWQLDESTWWDNLQA